MFFRMRHFFSALRKTLAFAVFGFCVVSFSGCAFLFNGQSEDISLDSIPSGAEVWFNGAYVGNTPLKLTYPTKKAPVVVLKYEGYKDSQIRIRRRLSTSGRIDAVVAGIPYVGIFPLLDFTRIGCLLEYSEDDVCAPLLQDGETDPLRLYEDNVEISLYSNNL